MVVGENLIRFFEDFRRDFGGGEPTSPDYFASMLKSNAWLRRKFEEVCRLDSLAAKED